MANNNHHSQLILAAASRLLADHQTLDYGWARRKAAENLGINLNDRQLPSLADIEAAVIEHQQIFSPQAPLLMRQLTAAAGLLQDFRKFSPRLVGPLTRGVTASNAVISIHCFAEAAKLVLFEIMDAGIRAESGDVTVMTSNRKREERPAFSFFHGDQEVLLIVLGLDEYRHPPLDPVTEKPAYGLDADALARRLAEEKVI
jgi:hypothetical protein